MFRFLLAAVGVTSTATCRISLTIPEKVVVDSKGEVVESNLENELEKVKYTLPNGVEVIVLEPQ